MQLWIPVLNLKSLRMVVTIISIRHRAAAIILMHIGTILKQRMRWMEQKCVCGKVQVLTIHKSGFSSNMAMGI